MRRTSRLPHNAAHRCDHPRKRTRQTCRLEHKCRAPAVRLPRSSRKLRRPLEIPPTKVASRSTCYHSIIQDRSLASTAIRRFATLLGDLSTTRAEAWLLELIETESDELALIAVESYRSLRTATGEARVPRRRSHSLPASNTKMLTSADGGAGTSLGFGERVGSPRSV